MIEYLVIAGALLNLSGSIGYARDTLAGRTKPNLVSFVLWATAPIIGAAAGFAQGGKWEVVPVLMTGVGPLLTIIASFFTKGRRWQLKRFDYICGIFSVLALILWRTTHEPNIAIFFAIISDALAAIPTIRKSWTHPWTETQWVYIAAGISQCTAFLAAPQASFAAWAFPIYLLLCCSLIAGILGWRRYVLPKP